MNEIDLWRRYQKYLCVCPTIGLQLDISRMMFADDFLGNAGGEVLGNLIIDVRLEQGLANRLQPFTNVGLRQFSAAAEERQRPRQILCDGFKHRPVTTRNSLPCKQIRLPSRPQNGVANTDQPPAGVKPSRRL